MALLGEARAKSTFEFTHSPFGLAQAMTCFQLLIYKVLRGLEFAFGYLDDILVFIPGVEMHVKHLCILFDRLRVVDPKCKEIKYNFLNVYVKYVGH